VPRIAILMALTLAACAPRPPATLHEIAEAYVRLTLQFAQHQPSLVDAWVGPESWRPGPRKPVADLHAALDQLISRTGNAGNIDRTERPRLDYLRGQLGALKVVARRLSGDSIRFEDELNSLFADRTPEPGASDFARERAALERELPGEGELVDRVAEFRRRFLVPEARVEAVLTAAIDACRRATATHIQLPSDERVEAGFDAAGDWAATATYVGRHQTRVRVSSRSGHDVSQLLHLACHETYPGHHVQHVLIDDALVRGRGWSEFQLTPAFGPHLAITEGWAEAGVDLAMPMDASARVYRETLMPLAGLPTADAERLARVDALAAPFAVEAVDAIGRYLDNERSADDTRQALRARALILAPDQLMALAERRRAAAVVYGASKRAIMSRQAGADETTKWRKLHDVFTVTPFMPQ
jgi:hypothetical protein